MPNEEEHKITERDFKAAKAQAKQTEIETQKKEQDVIDAINRGEADNMFNQHPQAQENPSSPVRGARGEVPEGLRRR